jgi:hypothetical protein
MKTQNGYNSSDPTERYNYHRARRDERKARCLKHLGGRGCISCGDRASDMLKFVHRPETEVSFAILANLTRRWAVLAAELEKCSVVCEDCYSSGVRPLKDGKPNFLRKN